MGEPTVTACSVVARVRVPDYLVGWWTELGINSATANATHVIWRIRGPQGAQRFCSAVRNAAARHAVLSSVVVRAGGIYYLEQRPQISEPSTERGISGDAAHLSAECQRVLERIIWTPFAEDAAVFRPFVIELSASDAVCGFVIHHRVVDYYGCQMLAREMRAELLGEVDSKASQGRSALQYADHLREMAEWIAGPEARRRLDYWRQAMRGTAPSRLPTARDADPAATGPLFYIDFELGPALRAELASAARSCRATLAAVTMAVHHIALAAAANQTDITANVLVSGRDTPALLGMVGYAADCVPVRAAVSAAALFPTFVRQVQDAFLVGCRQRVKWELVEEAMPAVGASAIIPVFNFIVGEEQPSEAKAKHSGGSDPDLTLEPIHVERAAERGSALFNISHTLSFFDTGQLVYAHIKYMGLRHDRQSIEAFLDRFLRCMAMIARDPFLPVGQILAS
jgi:hypothetical protein